MKINTGFTLVELVIVTAVLSILSAAALTMLNPNAQFQKANDARRKSDLSQIQRALESYYQDHGSYPASSSNKISDPQSGGTIIWGSPWGNYMNMLPQDPQSPAASYAYSVNSDGQGYRLYATLSRTNDSQACNHGLACPHAPSGACIKTCLYAATSPNEVP